MPYLHTNYELARTDLTIWLVVQIRVLADVAI